MNHTIICILWIWTKPCMPLNQCTNHLLRTRDSSEAWYVIWSVHRSGALTEWHAGFPQILTIKKMCFTHIYIYN